MTVIKVAKIRLPEKFNVPSNQHNVPINQLDVVVFWVFTCMSQNLSVTTKGRLVQHKNKHAQLHISLTKAQL